MICKLKQCLVQTGECPWPSVGSERGSLRDISHCKLWLQIRCLCTEKWSFQGCQSGTIHKERLHFRKGGRNLPRALWFGKTKGGASSVHRVPGKDTLNGSVAWLSVNCEEGGIITWALASLARVLFFKYESCSIVFKRNSKTACISKHHFQLKSHSRQSKRKDTVMKRKLQRWKNSSYLKNLL